ncbi:DUF1128 domain-containing protein [Gorillibacterium timonense]|uniref:DUF1128 domain-containing protein n=1 Tax=Gorillibacterium timonense TaxID=1689269 RepID=UPI00071D2233|nr:DUF1128 domain-containing protein [Gorillibacterium timonense]
MDLTKASKENVEYMIEQVKQKLRMASGAAIRAEHFDESRYEELVELYEHVAGKSTFSVSEIDAIVQELGRLRK